MSFDIEFPHRFRRIKITATNAAVHANKFGVTTNARLACERSRDVGHGSNANQRYLARGLHHCVANRPNTIVQYSARILFHVKIFEPGVVGMGVVV